LKICLTAYVFLERDRWALRGPLGSGRWRAARGQDALTAAAVAAQPFDENSNGRVRRYRAARQRFSCQHPDVAAPRALNSHSLLGTHAKQLEQLRDASKNLWRLLPKLISASVNCFGSHRNISKSTGELSGGMDRKCSTRVSPGADRIAPCAGAAPASSFEAHSRN